MKKRIALFLWRIAVKLIKPAKGKVIGLPYNRDPENPCEYYEPGKRGQYVFQDCETDGHYLCRKCCHRIPDQEAESSQFTKFMRGYGGLPDQEDGKDG